MLVMTNARHRPSNDVLALLGSVSAPVIARAHYCDRRIYDASVTQPRHASGEFHGSDKQPRDRNGNFPFVNATLLSLNESSVSLFSKRENGGRLAEAAPQARLASLRPEPAPGHAATAHRARDRNPELRLGDVERRTPCSAASPAPAVSEYNETLEAIAPPREPSEDDEDDEREDEDSDEDLDDHPEDFDARADYAARYNDYLRELGD